MNASTAPKISGSKLRFKWKIRALILKKGVCSCCATNLWKILHQTHTSAEIILLPTFRRIYWVIGDALEIQEIFKFLCEILCECLSKLWFLLQKFSKLDQKICNSYLRNTFSRLDKKEETWCVVTKHIFSIKVCSFEI